MKMLTPSSDATQEELLELWTVVHNFISKQNISCAEAIYQTDKVIINAYEFIEQLCDIVGYDDDFWEKTRKSIIDVRKNVEL